MGRESKNETEKTRMKRRKWRRRIRRTNELKQNEKGSRNGDNEASIQKKKLD